MRRLWLVLLLWLLPTSVGAQQLAGWTGIAVNKGDTIDIVSRSSDQCTQYVATTSGSALIYQPLSGIGCLIVGQTITGTALTGDTGTITAISSQSTQVPLAGNTTGSTHTNTTLDNIPTNVCAQVSATMYVTGTNIAASTYTTVACSAGSVTLSAATSGTASITDLTFTPAYLVSVNADATNACTGATNCATLIAGANQNVLTVSYTVQVANRSVNDSFTHTPTTDYTQTTDASAALPEGTLQSVTVQATTGVPEWGAVYACVRVCRNTAVIATLACGSPTANRPVSFVAGGPSTMDAAHDVYRMRTLAQPRPATGDDVRIVVPSFVSWEFVGVNILLQTSTTAGTRAPAIRLVDKEGISGHYGLFVGNEPLKAGAAALTYALLAAQGPVTEDRFNISQEADFAVVHDPGVTTQATITQASPGASFRNVVDAITCTLVNSAAAAAGVVICNLRDSTTGAGTIRFQCRVAIPAVQSSGASCSQSGLNLRMPVATATTWETSAAPATNVAATVSMKGHIETGTTFLRYSIPKEELVGGGKAKIILSGINNSDDLWTDPQWKVIERWRAF